MGFMFFYLICIILLTGAMFWLEKKWPPREITEKYNYMQLFCIKIPFTNSLSSITKEDQPLFEEYIKRKIVLNILSVLLLILILVRLFIILS